MKNQLNISYPVNEITIYESFLNVKFYNQYNLTSEQVEHRPILNQDEKVIGMMIEADEEYIYGIVYHASEIYENEKTGFSIEVCKC